MFSVSVRLSGESGYCSLRKIYDCVFVHRYVVCVTQFNRTEEQEALPIPPGPVYVFNIACTEKPLHRNLARDHACTCTREAEGQRCRHFGP